MSQSRYRRAADKAADGGRALARRLLHGIAPVDVPHPIVPSLRVPEHRIDRPYVPAVDVHAHLRGEFGSRWASRSAGDLIAALDRSGIEATVHLDGGYAAELEAEIRRLQLPHPDRFAVFANIDYASLSRDDDFGQVEADRLYASVKAGARGLKIWKTLGLESRDAAGDLIGIDDERLAPLWTAAAELRIPVLIHFADPIAFFEPLTFGNERWGELQRHPQWHYYPTRHPGDRRDPRPPSFEELHAQFDTLLARHRSTTFIGAHVASSAEDLGRASLLLERHPNLYVDTAARLDELGRQPYSSREFLIRFQDRVLFGTDTGPDPDACALYFRYFETQAEYMPYGPSPSPLRGNWRIYGVGLPEDVLRKIYRDNALKLIGFER